MASPTPQGPDAAAASLAAATTLTRLLLLSYLSLATLPNQPTAWIPTLAALELVSTTMGHAWMTCPASSASSLRSLIGHVVVASTRNEYLIPGAAVAGAAMAHVAAFFLVPTPLVLGGHAVVATLGGGVGKRVIGALQVAALLVLTYLYTPLLSWTSASTLLAALASSLVLPRYLARTRASHLGLHSTVADEAHFHPRVTLAAAVLTSLVSLVCGVQGAIALPRPWANGTLLAINAAIGASVAAFGGGAGHASPCASAGQAVAASLAFAMWTGLTDDTLSEYPEVAGAVGGVLVITSLLVAVSTRLQVQGHVKLAGSGSKSPIPMHDFPGAAAETPLVQGQGTSTEAALRSRTAFSFLLSISAISLALTSGQLAAGPPATLGVDPCASLVFDQKHPDPSPGTKVVITGGSGFIGSNLAELLLDLGYRVKVFDNLSTGYLSNIVHLLDHPNFTFEYGDILDLGAVERVIGKDTEYVYHLAAMSKVAPSMKDPGMARFCLETNSLGTINVLNASRNAGSVKKVVYAASSTYYGNGKVPMREDAAPDLLTPYSSSKYEGEIQMDIYDRIFNLPTVSIRFLMVYGPRNPTTGAYAIVTGVFTKKLQDGEPLPIEGDGSHYRDFIHAKDIGESLILAQQNPAVRNTVINAGTGVGHSVHDVADLVSPNHKHVAPRRNDLVGTLADTCRAKRVLGFKARYDFVTEMGNMIEDAKHPERVVHRPEVKQLISKLAAMPWLLTHSLAHMYRPVVQDLLAAAKVASERGRLASAMVPVDKRIVLIPFRARDRALVANAVYSAVTYAKWASVLLAVLDADEIKQCLAMNLPCVDASLTTVPSMVAQLLEGGYTVRLAMVGTSFVRELVINTLAENGVDVAVPQWADWSPGANGNKNKLAKREVRTGGAMRAKAKSGKAGKKPAVSDAQRVEKKAIGAGTEAKGGSKGGKQQEDPDLGGQRAPDTDPSIVVAKIKVQAVKDASDASIEKPDDPQVENTDGDLTDDKDLRGVDQDETEPQASSSEADTATLAWPHVIAFPSPASVALFRAFDQHLAHQAASSGEQSVTDMFSRWYEGSHEILQERAVICGSLQACAALNEKSGMARVIKLATVVARPKSRAECAEERGTISDVCSSKSVIAADGSLCAQVDAESALVDSSGNPVEHDPHVEGSGLAWLASNNAWHMARGMCPPVAESCPWIPRVLVTSKGEWEQRKQGCLGQQAEL